MFRPSYFELPIPAVHSYEHVQRKVSQAIGLNFHRLFYVCAGLYGAQNPVIACVHGIKNFLPGRMVMLAGKIEMAIGDGFTRL